MIVRQYRKGDLDALTSLYREFSNEIREQQGTQQLRLNQTEAKETAKESLNPNSAIFVAEEGGRLVGCRAEPTTRSTALHGASSSKTQGGPYVQLTFDHANNKHPEIFCPL